MSHNPRFFAASAKSKGFEEGSGHAISEQRGGNSNLSLDPWDCLAWWYEICAVHWTDILASLPGWASCIEISSECHVDAPPTRDPYGVERMGTSLEAQ